MHINFPKPEVCTPDTICPIQDCSYAEDSHGGELAAGSPNVFVNGLPTGRIGDPIDDGDPDKCNTKADEGSCNVFVNGLAAVRYGDCSTPELDEDGEALYPDDLEDCFPARPNNQGSGDVFINSLGAHRKTDTWELHCCVSLEGSSSSSSPESPSSDSSSNNYSPSSSSNSSSSNSSSSNSSSSNSSSKSSDSPSSESSTPYCDCPYLCATVTWSGGYQTNSSTDPCTEGYITAVEGTGGMALSGFAWDATRERWIIASAITPGWEAGGADDAYLGPSTPCPDGVYTLNSTVSGSPDFTVTVTSGECASQTSSSSSSSGDNEYHQWRPCNATDGTDDVFLPPSIFDDFVGSDPVIQLDGAGFCYEIFAVEVYGEAPTSYTTFDYLTCDDAACTPYPPMCDYCPNPSGPAVSVGYNADDSPLTSLDFTTDTVTDFGSDVYFECRRLFNVAGESKEVLIYIDYDGVVWAKANRAGFADPFGSTLNENPNLPYAKNVSADLTCVGGEYSGTFRLDSVAFGSPWYVIITF